MPEHYTTSSARLEVPKGITIKPPSDFFQKNRGPNKLVLVFFFLLTISIFSYLIFNATDSTTPLHLVSKTAPASSESGYMESLTQSIINIKNKLFSSESVVFTARQKIKGKKGYTKEWKRILIYTKLFGTTEWYHLPRSVLGSIMKRCKCKIQTCKVTYNKRLFKKSDGVIFHAADMPNIDQLSELRRKSKSKQRWVYFTSESPRNVPDTTLLKDFFNLTMTVSLESDIWLPYGKFVPLTKKDKRPSPLKNYAEGKEPGAAWLVSHCGTLRDEYVLKLQEEYPVHVGGSCGPLFKYQMVHSKNYDAEIKTKYKYYLAFENGFCKNYITEKYWDRAIQNDVLPIVMGSGPYDQGQHGAIPGSYINVETFSTVSDLAFFLHYLDKNDTAYNEFFRWKQMYKTYEAPYGNWPHPCTFLCELCDILHNLDYPEKSYDMVKFVDVRNNCEGRDRLVRAILAHSPYLYDRI